MPKSLDVYLDTHLVGILTQENTGQIVFAYHPEWLTHPEAMPLSLSLPLRVEPYLETQCRPYFAGLLPEGEQRQKLARIFNISARNDFALLDEIGGECAGAVSFVESGQPLVLPSSAHYRLLSRQDFAEILRQLPRRPLMAGDDGLRLSLAGAQSKLAVHSDSGLMFLPMGKISTFIIKPSIPDYPDSVLNEAFCLTLAKSVGLHTVDVWVGDAEGLPYLAIARYDRVKIQGKQPSGMLSENFLRLHQEDFCQALGIPAEKKYQREGGPTFKQCFDLLRQASSLPAQDLKNLLDMVLFNLLVGNNDAHGKNFSLLQTPSSTRLAPLYDVLCTELYPDLASKMAMKFGGADKFKDIYFRHVERFAQDIGFSAAAVRQQLRTLSQTVLAKMETEKSYLNPPFGLPDLIATRCQRMLDVLDT